MNDQAGNQRRCTQCDAVIDVGGFLAMLDALSGSDYRAYAQYGERISVLENGRDWRRETMLELSAWELGFCSPDCLILHGLDKVQTQRAWWFGRASTEAKVNG